MAAYAALVSLANTIDRFLNSNLYSISLEEKQQVISLLEYVTPFQHFLVEFPDKFKSLEGRMREAAHEAEDILEYLVLEKVFLCSDEESEPHELDCITVINEICLKLNTVVKEFRRDFADEALKDRLNDVADEAENIIKFLRWKKDHIRFRDKWRFLPAEFAKFKSEPHFADHLNKVRSEIDSVMAEVMAMKNKWRFLPAKFPKFKFKHHTEKIRKEFDLMAGKVMSMKKNNRSIINEDMEQLGDSAATTASSSGIVLHDNDDDDDEEEEEDFVPDDEDDDDYDEESQCCRSAKHKLQLKRVMEEIALIAAQAKEITHSSSSKDVECGGADSSAALSSSSPAPPILKNAMVGFQDYVLDLKDQLCGEPSKLQVIPICGMGGIGKTTLARYVYDNPLTVSRFDVRIWVTISQDFSAKMILSSILDCLKRFKTSEPRDSDDVKVHKILMRRRYLVVMDDIWSIEAWDVVRRAFPDDGNGSRVILTTRLFDVASYPDPLSKIYEMSLLNADESWDLLKQNVFGDDDCPSELENIGKQIARTCKGLPLAIVVIAGLLSTTTRNLVSWKVTAETVKSAEKEHIEEILSLSYSHLPQYLRPYFLYMGSFPEDHEIRVKKLIRLWVAEGFVKSPVDSDSSEKVAEECLEELVKRNLLLVIKRKWDGRIKSCSLHDLMRELCIRKSHESKFFLNLMVRRIGKDSFIENIRSQRRVRLSRVLDGYGLPTLVHSGDLFHLRYLGIGSFRDIPTSLSMLQNLQTLVTRKEIRSCGVEVISDLVLPWCMSQLRHVHYQGTIRFQDPEETDCPLESLQTLSYVSHHSCREMILKMIPNLKKLQINCSQALYRGACLNDLVHLHQLETLEIYGGGNLLERNKIAFPRTLKKLILMQLKLPWNDIFVFSSLPNLQVLKLILCTCVGGTWETTEGTFPVLEVLEISGSSFGNWVTESSHFPMLKLLLLHSCDDLRGISNDIGEIPTLQLIEVKGVARKSLIESVEVIREEQEDMGNDTLQVVCTAKPSRQ